MRKLTIGLLLMVAAGLISCSALNPFTPGPELQNKVKESAGDESNRWVWGNWWLYVPEDHSSVEVVPVRTADMHYNVKIFLEKEPCDNCVWTSNFINNGDGTISIDISMRHPFPENKYYTGFDVRGIFYSSAHYFFEDPYEPHNPNARYFPALETGDPQLLNPDGYTNAFSAFKYNPKKQPILRYQPGGHLGGTLDIDDKEEPDCAIPYWPFIYYYSSDVRRHFATNAVVTRTYHIALPPGPWKFGYSVDAVWAPPTKTPVTNVETDFPWEANQLAPYHIDIFISGPLIGQEPSIVTARFYHHFPKMLEFYHSADLWAQCFTEHLYNICSHDPEIVGNEYVEFNFELVNELKRPPGIYPVLVDSYNGTDGDEYLWDVKGVTEEYWENATIAAILWVTVES